jgi:signal transduction histidine kinase
MVAASAADQEPPRAGRPVAFRFGARLVAPVACLVLLWGLITGAVLGGALDGLLGLSSGTADHRALVESTVITGAGVVVILATVLLMGSFTGLLSGEISGLTAMAHRLADEQFTRAGEQAGTVPWPDVKTAEIAAAALAIARMQRTAITAAAAEAGARHGLRQILASLGKRNASLLHRQLRIIDALEQQAPSPAALADLFALDHLTTRMRRHAESLTILSGAAPARSWSGPVSVIDVIRAAVAETEDYKRVTVLTDTDEAVMAPAVTDVIHLLAELIENAAMFSPSSTRVEVRAERVANGFAVEVEDRGLGIATEQLSEINKRLADPPDFDLADADRLGLFVAGRLAARHGVEVSLCPSPYRGTKAVVMLPDSIVMTTPEPVKAQPAIHGSARLNLRSAEPLSPVGAGAVRSLPAADDARTADRGALAEEPVVGTFHGLPRRVRPGASAREPGREPGRAPGSAATHAPTESPAPEHARNLVTSLRSSWQRSQETDDDPDTAKESTAQESTAQESEETLWLTATRPADRTSPGCLMTSPPA